MQFRRCFQSSKNDLLPTQTFLFKCDSNPLPRSHKLALLITRQLKLELASLLLVCETNLNGRILSATQPLPTSFHCAVAIVFTIAAEWSIQLIKAIQRVLFKLRVMRVQTLAPEWCNRRLYTSCWCNRRNPTDDSMAFTNLQKTDLAPKKIGKICKKWENVLLPLQVSKHSRTVHKLLIGQRPLSNLLRVWFNREW